MRTLVRSVLLAATAAVAVAGHPTAGPAAEPGKSVELTDVTFDGLDQSVRKNQGSVVVVDVWSTFCTPCKKKFPHMVSLYKQHAKDGLVLITLSIDDKGDRAKAVEFLKKQDATCTNFFLTGAEEGAKKWEEKYPVEQIPLLLVYNRKGERVLQDFGKIAADDLDKLVEKLVAEK